MKKILLVLCVFIFSACGQVVERSNIEQSSGSILVPDMHTTDEYCAAKKDASCMDAFEKMQRGIASKDDCARMKDSSGCIRRSVSIHAKDVEDVAWCGALSIVEDKKECEDSFFLFMATKYHDVRFCEKISSQEMKENCKTNSTRDFSCGKSSDDKNMDCTSGDVWAEKISQGIQVDCGRILDMSERRWCTQEMILLRAKQEQIPSLCEGLSTSFSYKEIRGKNYRKVCEETVHKKEG